MPNIVLLTVVSIAAYFAFRQRNLQIKEDETPMPRPRYKRFIAGVDYPKTVRTGISEKYHITTNIALEKLIRVEAAAETKRDWLAMSFEYKDRHLLAEKIFEYCEPFIWVDKIGKATGRQVRRIEEALFEDPSIITKMPLGNTEDKTVDYTPPTAAQYLRSLFVSTVSGKTYEELKTYRVYSLSPDGIHDSYDQEYAVRESKKHLFPKLWLMLHCMNIV